MSEPRELLPSPPHLVAKIRELADRRLTPEEFAAYVNAPMTDEERDEIVSLIRWFRRRYPTVAERLAQARRAYAQWARSMPPK